MLRHRLFVPAVIGLLGALSLVLSAPLHAAFHLMKVVQVFPGTAAAPNAQYVIIQMYSGGQNQVSGHGITVFDAAGVQIQQFLFSGAVANGANQSRILIATPEAVSFFGLSADLSMSAALLSAGGKVCFDSQPEDCLAWGNYSGSLLGIGTPYNVANGLRSGRAAIRRLDIAGGASTLEAADDTDNCANDFVEGLPDARNNAGQIGVIPPAVCPNSIVEGLEECDDGNATNGDGCSSTCTIEPLVFADGFE